MHSEEKSGHTDRFGNVSYPEKVETVSDDGHRRAIGGGWQEFSGRLLLLDTSERVPSSTAVSIEREDVLLIGEAIGWIKVEHKLTSLQSLLRLRIALIGQSDSAPVRPRLKCLLAR